MRSQLRVGSFLSWTIAWALAVAGPALDLADQSSVSWWLGLLLVIPLFALAIWRAEVKGYDSSGAYPGDGPGPYGAP